MKSARRQFLVAVTATLALAGAVPLRAENATTVNITLWDKGPMSLEMMDKHPMMGMGMMKNADMSMAMMGITSDAQQVPAGDVTFNVTNTSKEIIHEMIVAPIKAVGDALPYDEEAAAVDEDAAGALGEVPELDAGKSGTVTLHLQPGTYILFCNIPGHFAVGMWTTIEVAG